MNVIALILIAIAALIELLMAAQYPSVAKNYGRLHPLALGLFFTGFILTVLFNFWLVAPVGSGGACC
jgi:hypothetical protein